MNKNKNVIMSTNSETLSREQLLELLGGCGKNTALRIAREANAILKIGRRTLFLKGRILDWLEEQAQ